MRSILHKTLFVFLSLAVALPAMAATREEERVADASDVIDQLLRIPEKTLPPTLLSRAYAIAVVPNVVKVGLASAPVAAREFSSFDRMTTPGVTPRS